MAKERNIFEELAAKHKAEVEQHLRDSYAHWEPIEQMSRAITEEYGGMHKAPLTVRQTYQKMNADYNKRWLTDGTERKAMVERHREEWKQAHEGHVDDKWNKKDEPKQEKKQANDNDIEASSKRFEEKLKAVKAKHGRVNKEHPGEGKKEDEQWATAEDFENLLKELRAKSGEKWVNNPEQRKGRGR